MPIRTGHAEWRGDLGSGDGDLTVGAGVFRGQYSFRSRFEEGEGTNPEELLAAAHAACFAMALSNTLSQAGHVPASVRVDAKVDLRPVDGEPTVARIQLEAEGDVPGISEAEFTAYAEQTSKVCPISRALAAVPEIAVTARLTAAAG